MKVGLLPILCLLLIQKQAYATERPEAIVKSDSLPSQQTAVLTQERYRYRLGSFGNQTANKRLVTVFVSPKSLRLGNEVTLPVGIDERTVVVRSGDKTLKLWEDYVFIPDTNKMRILDEDALKSERSIRITYERLY
ncbi:hypothetical protein [Spirosoma gilvum]